MSDKHRRRRQSSSKRFASNGAKFISPATACSRQILNITSAAVNALGKSDHADLAYGTTDSVPLADEMSRGFVELDASKKDLSYQDCLTDEPFTEKSTSSKLFSTESVAAAEKAILIDSNDTDSSTLLPGNSLEKAVVLDLSCSSSSRETSFNGKHRVRIPSRLLREIKSPVERPGLTNHPHEVQVQDSKGKLHSKATPVVIRHQNEPSAWVLRPANTLQMLPEHKSSLPQDPVKVPTSSFDTVLLTTAGNVDGLKIDDKPSEQIVSPRDVTYFNKKPIKETGKLSSQQDVSFHKETTVPAVNRELNGAGLQQGDPVSGLIVPSDSTSSGAVTTKVFGLSDKEKSLKESFLRRQESKGPVKRFVQPTVVSARQEETKEREDESQIKSDNPVATAAAIAAAAASAATAPFLQIQHGLESQISALVSNLQVLHQHQTTAQQQHQLSQELLIQQQIQLRLTKLEEAQKQLLELQKQQAVTYRKAEEQIENKTDSGLSSHHFDEAVNNPTNANIPYSRAPDRMTVGIPSRVSSVPYSSASPFHPHPVSTALVYPHTLPTARKQASKTEPSLKYTLVKNTKTQTSPQESVSPQESLLQTPLPRKRPPVPMSRHARPNSRSGGSQPKHREQEKRVHFDKPARDFTPMGLYNDRTSNKARRLLEEIVGPNPSPSDEDKTASSTTLAIPSQDKRNALSLLPAVL